MDWKSFIASVLGSFAWPSVVVVLLVVLRSQIRGLANRIEELTLPGGTSAKFGKQLDKARAQAELVRSPDTVDISQAPSHDDEQLRMAYEYPEAVVLDAFKKVEEVLLRLRSELDLPVRTNLNGVLRFLIEKRLVGPQTQELFTTLRSARNAAAHAGGAHPVTPGEAIEYAGQARILGEVLENAFESLRRKQPSRR